MADTFNLTKPYSATNPVPKVATNLKSVFNPSRATERKSREVQHEQEESRKQEETTKDTIEGKKIRVRDPTTGEDVDVKNADADGDGVPDADVENRGKNILETEFPPPDWNEHKNNVVSTTCSSLVIVGASYALSTIFFRTVPLPYFTRDSFGTLVLSLLLPSILTYCLLFRLRRVSLTDFENRVWHSERLRGLAGGSDRDGDGVLRNEEKSRESAGWANSLLRGIWPIVNPEMFRSMVDMIEDIMQASVPKSVQAVRISDLGLGQTPFRITSIRSLRDADVDTEISNIEKKDREQLESDHANFEVSFAFKAQPSGKTAQSKAKNPHLLIDFFLGVKGVWVFSVPVWVELTGVVGTARVRLQLISDPPFVKTTLVTLLGLPRIDVSVIPMKVLPNIMDLPLISGFISSSIKTAAAEYVAPKSLTLDLQQLISGDDIKKDTDCVGVLFVHIHRALGIKKMDTRGASADPYVTLTYSRLGKPLFSTRIIEADLNPVFEETAILKVDVNVVKLKEQLSFQLWDSDRMSADDMMGFVEVDLADLMRQKGTPVRRISPLVSPDSQDRPGTLEYTVGYYAKTWPNPALKTDGSDPNIPEDLKTAPEFQRDQAKSKATALNKLEAAVLVTPPDTKWPSGILGVQVHEIKDLTVKTYGRENSANVSRQGQKGQDDNTGVEEENEGLPSSYCTISLNDDLVYKTRIKAITSTPMFNAGAERFVRDWRTSHISVQVHDSRMRENDAILGVVVLKLSECFRNASQITRYYSLQNGIGYGRIRISLLFRPVEAQLPRNLLGFETGSLNLKQVSVTTADEDLSNCELRIRTSNSKANEKASHRNAKSNNGVTTWALDQASAIPVRQRYGSCLYVAFRNTAMMKGSRKSALATLWLQDICDNEESTVEVALWKAKDGNFSRLKQNYTPPSGSLDDWDSDRENLTRIGTVQLHLVFTPGISDAHKEMLRESSATKKRTWDGFDREKTGGLREDVGQFEGHHDFPSRPRDGSDGILENERKPSVNTFSTGAAVENESLGDTEGSDTLQEVDPDQGGEPRSKGLVGKVKDWKEHERELHRDHRGVMQTKPARTAEWIKDNVQEGAHSIKSKFAMKSRQPDVETEV